MSVNLQKGQRVELRKEDGGTLRKVSVGLGWDEAKPQGKGFFLQRPQAVDCDASAFLCQKGHLKNASDIIYYGHLIHSSKAVRHMGDNLTGAGDGDDEQIQIDLPSLPYIYDRIVFVVNIYQAAQRRQHFGMIENAFIRICDAETGKELCRYNLSENYTGMTAMIFGELYRHGDVWKFGANGQPTQDKSISELADRFA